MRMTERGLERGKQLVHGAHMAAFTGVGIGWRSGGHGQHELLAFKGAPAAISPTGLDHVILPLLEQSGRAVPVERELQHDAVMRFDEPLLMFDVDSEIRICGVFIDHGHVSGFVGRVHKLAVDLRFFQMRMEHQNQRFHAYSF